MNNDRFTYDQLREKVDKLEAENKLLKYQKELLSNHAEIVVWGTESAVWDWNYTTGVVKFTDKKAELLGYLPSELDPDVYSFTKMIHPEDYDYAMSNMKNHLMGKTDRYEVQYRIKTKEGGWKWFLDKGKVVERDSENKPLRILGIVSDITDKKNALIRLKESKQRFKNLFHFNSDGVRIIDHQGIIIDLNQRMSEITGYTYEETIGKYIWDVIFRHTPKARQTQEVYNRIKKLGEEALQTGKFQFHNPSDEIELVCADGSTKIVETSYFAVASKKGFMLYSIIHDVTSFKLNQRELAKANLTKAESEAKLKLALDVAHMGYWKYDVATKKVEWSSGHYVLFGVKPELFGQNLDAMQACIHVDDQKGVLQNLIHSLKHDTIFDQTYRIIRPNGDLRWMHSYGYLYKSDNNASDYLFGITHDITKRIISEMELIAAKEKAEESEKLKTAFLNNISHEIRTPLNAICGFSELLVNQNQSDGNLKRFSKIISSSSDKLIGIITDVIEIAQIQAKQISLKKVDFDLIVLLNELQAEFEPIASIKELKFAMNIAPQYHTYHIQTDRYKLYRILKHLLDNAVKFTNSGRVLLNVNISESEIEFNVSDTGIGVKTDMQDIIFDPFRQVESGSNRTFGGNGVGLAIVKGYTDLLNGNIKMISEAGKGSVFKVCIPRPFLQISKPHISTSKIKIDTLLIVEDEISNYLFLQEILNGYCNILHALNGKQAVELCKTNNRVNVVLMDIKTKT